MQKNCQVIMGGIVWVERWHTIVEGSRSWVPWNGPSCGVYKEVRLTVWTSALCLRWPSTVRSCGARKRMS